jgi:DNA-binding response OmpR family regulator
MSKILFIGDNQRFYEALRKQIQLSQNLSLEFLATHEIKAPITNLTEYGVIILDIICLNHKKASEIDFLKEIMGLSSIALVQQKSDADLAYIHEFLMDEVIFKPFKVSTLIRHVYELINRPRDIPRQHNQFVRYTFLQDEKLLVHLDEHKQIRLTEKETAILQKLAAVRGKVVSRHTLLEEVWGYKTGVDSHTLETHMYRLRRKIEENGNEGPVLVTATNGYKIETILT